jgi:aldose 1-epimerase
MSQSILRTEFGRLPDGTAADLFVLDNGKGLRVSVTNWGGIITSVTTPDRDGVPGEVTLAHDTLEEYLAGHPYYGAFIGRFANRISGGGFAIEGARYELAANNGPLHLHGGIRGFDKQLYAAEAEETPEGVFLHLRRTSPAGEEGYPGNLEVLHTIGVTPDMRLTMTFEARTDAPTVFNPTNHTYWNLGDADVMDHELRLNCDRFVEIHEMVPTGEMPEVADSPFDFRTAKLIGRDFDAVVGPGINGYDHCFVIDGWKPDNAALREAARLRCDATGREMVVRTTFPGVQFYSGNNLPGERGRDGAILEGQEALCLECQFFPDSPNRPEFPSVELRPGQVYLQRTEHEFGTY